MWEEQLSRPVVRITTFGPFSVEWLENNSEQRYTPISADKIDAKGVLPARSLLKLLLCQPHRYAPRDWVLEQFWPDMEHKAALHRVGNVIWILRRLLCPPDAQDSLRSLLLTSTQSDQGTGLGYQLAAYPLIWVDADAFESCVEQAARLSRFGDDPLPYWQRAYELGSRGTFLADEIYSEWATQRRNLLSGHFRQCVFEFSRLLIARGLTTEAEVYLRKYVVSHPTDEDVLRPLMELLGEQERYQELLGYYQTCETTLADEDRQPDSRTQDIKEYFKSKQIRRAQTPVVPTQALFSVKPNTKYLPPSQSLPLGLLASLSQQTTLQGIMQTGSSFEGTDVERTGMKIPRRDFFQEMLISSLLFANLGDEQYAALTQLFSGNYLSVFEQELERRWTAYHTGHSASAHQGLQLWLGATEVYAKEQTNIKQRNDALILASMGRQLQGSIYRDWMNYEQAHHAYRQSFLLADELGDLEVKVSSLARRGVTFIQQQKSIEAIEYLESAMKLLGELRASHLRGYILQALSEAHAMAQHHEKSDEAIDLAEKVLQEKSDIEERSHCQLNTTSVTAQRGVNATLLERYQKAMNLIEAGLAAYSPNLLRGRARLIAQQAEAYFRLSLIDQSVKAAIEALTLANSINSQKTIMRVRSVSDLLAQSPYRGEKNVVQLQTML